VNPIGTTSCTYNNWDGTFPYDARQNFGPSGLLGSPNPNLSASCAQTAVNVSGQVIPIRTYNFAPDLKPAYLNEYAAGIEIGLSRNYSIRFDVSRKFDFGSPLVMSATGGTATSTTGKAVGVLLPFSTYTDVRCVDDPGRDGIPGTPDDNPHGKICTYSVPASNPNRTVTNILYTNYNKNEGVASYTGYDVTFNKNYSNGWSLLAGYAISLAHPGIANPLTPDQMLYNHNFTVPTWNQSFKVNGSYSIPGIPLFGRHKFEGLQWSSTFTVQSGDWLDRMIDVTNALGTTVTLNIDPHFARKPSVDDWDQRISKRFRFKERHTIEIDWDLYNTLNRNYIASYTTTNVSSSNYLQPDKKTPLRPSSTGVLAPRIYEWGITYRF